MKLKRYRVRHPLLQQSIKFFWVIERQENIALDHNLLPVENIDVVFNFAEPMTVFPADRSGEPEAVRFHLTGMRNRSFRVSQKGTVESIGISFYPTGLFPFLNIPVSEFFNRTVELETIDKLFARELYERLLETSGVSRRLDVIEAALLRMLNPELAVKPGIQVLFNTFLSGCRSHLNIDRFCRDHGVNKRKLERLFNKYVGISPKAFHRVSRFTGIVNMILSGNYNSLTALAYDFEYYDQTHFIKDFKAMAGCSPSRFSNWETSIKDVIEYL